MYANAALVQPTDTYFDMQRIYSSVESHRGKSAADNRSHNQTFPQVLTTSPSTLSCGLDETAIQRDCKQVSQ